MRDLHISRDTLTLFLVLSFLPLWGTGLARGQNFWKWTWAHTVFAPDPMYVPEELYA